MNKKRSNKKRSESNKKRSRTNKKTRRGGYVWKSAPNSKSRSRSTRKSVKNTKSIMASLLPPAIN